MRASSSDEDRKVKLETLYDRLSAVVFHERLGNLKEKSERIRQIALFVGRSMGVDPQSVERASALLKADLLTHMVGEFPELQGVMGRMYALAQGEKEDVARSIEEHYFPVGTSGALPGSDLGTVMALSDKMDSLAAFFSVGITPTGNLDPFALRRQALGIIKIVVNRGLHIPLQELISIALQCAAG